MRTQSIDTHPDIERKQIELFREFSIPRKFELVANLTDAAATINQLYRQDLMNRIKWDYGKQWLQRSIAFRRTHPEIQPRTINIAQTVLDAIASLERRRIPFALAGRIACDIYGLPSSLHSIEIWVDHPRHLNLSPRHTRIGDTFLDITHVMLVDITRTTQGLKRARPLPLIHGHQPIPTLSPEDVTIDLLERFAATGSRDDALYNDLLGMVKVQAPTLDVPYLYRKTTKQHLLEQLLIDGGILP